jgi:beta-N-acetylhexosaminidase
LINGLRERARPVVLVSFGSPYQLQQAPDLSSYLIAWGGTAASQRAAARALLGEIPITGVLPIAIPPWLPLGSGEQRAMRPSVP